MASDAGLFIRQRQTPSDVFGNDLSEKYDRLTTTVEISGSLMTIERRMEGAGESDQSVRDGSSMPARDFCAELLRRLDIPSFIIRKGIHTVSVRGRN